LQKREISQKAKENGRKERIRIETKQMAKTHPPSISSIIFFYCCRSDCPCWGSLISSSMCWILVGNAHLFYYSAKGKADREFSLYYFFSQ
jgi:hypothetical protein